MAKDRKILTRKANWIVLLVMAAIMILIYRVAFANVQKHYTKQLYSSVLDQKQILLEQTVDNLVCSLEEDRLAKQQEFQNVSELYRQELDDLLDDSQNPKQDVEKLLKEGAYAKYWTYMIYRESDYEVIADAEGLLGDSFSGDTSDLSDSFITLDKVEGNGYVLLFGVRNYVLDKELKDSFARKVYKYEFQDDSASIWVDEVRNLDGGDGFAVRLINTEDKKSEGQRLSTNSKDKSEKAYLQEMLDGINSEGKAIYSFDYENEETGNLTKKLTYSVLYEDFDWIISMGMDLDDVVAYVNKGKEASNKLMLKYGLLLSFVFVIMISMLFIITVRGDEKYFAHRQKKLQKKVERDALTNAYSRAFGEEKLSEAYQTFMKGKDDPALMILDVDYFKSINDTYGHDAGDLILKRVVSTINRTVRRTDFIIRWGGDEFIGVFPDLERIQCPALADKIVDALRKEAIMVDGTMIHITASVGFAYFDKGDGDYSDGLKRADEALYKSKEGGRNQAHVKLDA